MQNTNTQFDNIISGCKNVFINKTKDYGTSWRVYRPISVADQVYIKARRIRTIQEKALQKIGDDIRSEFSGIVNYAVIGLIQLDFATDEPEQLLPEIVSELYDDKIKMAFH